MWPIRQWRAVPTISWRDAHKYVGKEVCAVGKIIKTGKSKTGHTFLNFIDDRKGLTVFIHKDKRSRFPEAPDRFYRGKTVKVRGFVAEFKGGLEIQAGGPEVLAVVTEGVPASSPAAAGPATRPAVDDTITIGSYNVLNLFDAVNDPYANDDNTPVKPRDQLEAVARTIRTLNADVLALVEVENRGYLQQFLDVFLPDMGYEVVLYEGNDLRGIDVAVLSRLPVGPVTSYRHLRFPDADGNPMRFQRDLLRVRIEPSDAAAFEVFVVHLKSKEGDDDSGLELRLGETRAIRRVIDELMRAQPNLRFVICGDFNDYVDSEPLKTLLGSGGNALSTFVSDLKPGETITYNQPPHLSMIDFILASPAMARMYVPNSYRVTIGGSPAVSGSDHNPVAAKFRLN